MKYPRIALCGWAGAGKDEAARPLIEQFGYERCCFGDLIKGQLDELIRDHFGFSAFTEDREQKAKIRRTLEAWGEDNYDAITRDYFAALPPVAVNTRLVRVREAEAWKLRGGIIVWVHRPSVFPATTWELERGQELHGADLIDFTVENAGTVADLHAQMVRLARGEL